MNAKSNGFPLSALAAVFALSASAVTLTVDKVQQRYPWNGLVDVDYTISLASGEDPIDILQERLVFSFVDEGVSSATTNAMLAVNDYGPVPMEAGTHRVTWNANADGVTTVSSAAKVLVTLRRYAVKYLVVDLSGGKDATSYPVTYLDAPPAGGFNTDEYKGDKMVLRLLPPGSFTMGSPTNQWGRSDLGREDQHNVTLTKPFYIGIFELTQAQWTNVIGSVGYVAKSGAYFPMINLTYSYLRNNTPEKRDVPKGTFLDKLRTKTGLMFDFPSDSQWEYACRAGTTGMYCNGTPTAGDDATLGAFVKDYARTAYNSGGWPNQNFANVGSYEPNDWGLYDMHGNAGEMVIDSLTDDVVALNQKVDPVGPTPHTRITYRSGLYDRSASQASSSYKYEWTAGGNNPTCAGLRLAVTLE